MSQNYKIKKWIEDVILSCITLEQVDTVENLVLNFKKKMKKDDYDYMLLKPFIIDLQYKVEQKRKEIIKYGV